jgi:Transglycosylase SLT domain
MVLGLLKSPFGRSLLIIGCLAMLLLAAKPQLDAAYADAWYAHHDGKTKRGQRAAHPPARALPAPPPTRVGRADIPPAYLALYRQAAHTCAGLRWSVLAGVGKRETNHGRGSMHGAAGEQGPMQFMPGTWQEYGQGGNPYDPRDAIPAAARKLCADGVGHDERAALYAYNCGRPYCAVSTGYVNAVLAFARSYEGG